MCGRISRRRSHLRHFSSKHISTSPQIFPHLSHLTVSTVRNVWGMEHQRQKSHSWKDEFIFFTGFFWFCRIDAGMILHIDISPLQSCTFANLNFRPNWRWMSIPLFYLLYEIDGYLHPQQQCLALHFFRKASCLPDSFSEIDMLAKWIFWSDTSFLLLLPLHLANTESERPGECVLHGDSTGRKRKRGKAACYAHVADISSSSVFSFRQRRRGGCLCVVGCLLFSLPHHLRIHFVISSKKWLALQFSCSLEVYSRLTFKLTFTTPRIHAMYYWLFVHVHNNSWLCQTDI